MFDDILDWSKAKEENPEDSQIDESYEVFSKSERKNLKSKTLVGPGPQVASRTTVIFDSDGQKVATRTTTAPNIRPEAPPPGVIPPGARSWSTTNKVWTTNSGSSKKTWRVT